MKRLENFDNLSDSDQFEVIDWLDDNLEGNWDFLVSKTGSQAIDEFVRAEMFDLINYQSIPEGYRKTVFDLVVRTINNEDDENICRHAMMSLENEDLNSSDTIQFAKEITLDSSREIYLRHNAIAVLQKHLDKRDLAIHFEQMEKDPLFKGKTKDWIY